MSAKTLIITALASAVLFCLGDRFGMLFDSADGSLMARAEFASGALLSDIASDPIVFSLEKTPLAGGLAGALAAWCAWAALFAAPNNFRFGEEYGSARWATRRDMKGFFDRKDRDNNIILTKNARLALSRRRPDIEHDRNLNVLVIGGSGAGKTRFYVKPNLMQLNANYFITDPKGTLLPDCGHLFVQSGYEIRCFNTIDWESSHRANPLFYVKTDEQILSFVKCLIANTNGDRKASSSDPFWENAETLLYVSLIALLRDWFPPSDYTLPTLVYLLSLAKAKEDDEDFSSPLDQIFSEIETGRRYVEVASFDQAAEYDEKSRMVRRMGSYRWVESNLVNNRTNAMPGKTHGMRPEEDFALFNYRAFKSAAGKTLKSIIISCNVRLAPLAIDKVARVLSGALDDDGEPTGVCELHLDELGDADRKTVVFGIISDTDKTFAFLLALLMYQTVDVLCNRALLYGGSLPRHVSIIFDEFANIGTIPNIDETIAITRSRNIGISVIVQSLAQLTVRYDKDRAKVIQSNCDTVLFLGGADIETCKEISETIGKQTIDQRTFNESRGRSSGYTKNYNVIGRSLIDPSEISALPRTYALVLIKGHAPFRDRKYDLTKHPRYGLIDPGHENAQFSAPYDFKEHLRAQAAHESTTSDVKEAPMA